MFDSIYSQIWAVALLLTCGLALLKGDRPEQTAAVVCLISWLATVFAQDDTASFTPEHLWLAIDTSVLAVFVGIAWKSQRSWPIFAAAFQSIAVVIHIAFLLDLSIGTRAYIAALAISSYGALGALAVGTWRVWREREALGFTQK
ncbi:hypothetical protein [Caulobacter sp. 17J80-11]|uniref:hypothetical protein n=1 Tax=Caulobacter sp. 17J80-11 TaxID=2763502 RepID=UPI0016535FE1|nr:hypothetical protein [Caulobacter sp. 17J80-11]MBC6983104.1 hypothetical protein [Caulobacter sp. 17J80-11]